MTQYTGEQEVLNSQPALVLISEVETTEGLTGTPLAFGPERLLHHPQAA